MALQAETDRESELSNDLCWLLSRAAHALTAEMTVGLESLGVSPRAQCVLATALTGELTQIEIARTIGLDKTTMVVTIDELERLGLAERQPSKTDRRARVIRVTKAGEEKVREGKRIADRIRRDVLETLPEEQRELFIDALATLVHERFGAQAGCVTAGAGPAPD